MEPIAFSSAIVEHGARNALKRLPGGDAYLVKEGRSHRISIEGALKITRLRFHSSDFTADDLADLAYFRNLALLEIFSFGITSLDPFPALPSLKTFRLRAGERVFDISPLTRCAKLRDLDLCGTALQSAQPLEQLTMLHTLNLYGCGVEGLEWLRGLVSLSSLELNGNAVADLTPLAGLKKLKVLNLGGNRISDIEPIGTLGSLMTLNLENNDISEVKTAAALPNLERLLLSGNRITDVSALASLGKLRVLDLSANPLGDVTALAQIHSLELAAVDADPRFDGVFSGFEKSEQERAADGIRMKTFVYTRAVM